MISPCPGVAFTETTDGDMRADRRARADVSRLLGIGETWATVNQIHGDRVVVVDEPGVAGDADALATGRAGLPLAVFTADCMGVVVMGERGVGVAHAGWRGMAKGVVSALVETMGAAGLRPVSAWCGPTIGACCYEVGPEVAELFAASVGSTTWGTASVDLARAARMQLEGFETSPPAGCTMHQGPFFSHRRDGSTARMATLAWWGGEPA
jgi:hypothetical protein